MSDELKTEKAVLPRHLRGHATFGDDPSGWCGCAGCDPRETCGCPSCRKVFPPGGVRPECERTASCEPGDHTYSWPCVYVVNPPGESGVES